MRAASLAVSAGEMIPRTNDCLVGQTPAEGEKDQSNAEIGLKFTRGVHKQVVVRACATLTATCLIMGLAFTTFEPDQFHEATRVLSAHSNQSENGSNPLLGRDILLGSIRIWRPSASLSVSSIRVCNALDQTPVRLLVGGPSKLPGNRWVNIGTAWVSITRPCLSIPRETLQQYFPDGLALQCSFLAQNYENTAIPCYGGGFSYSSTSLLSGEYDCGGSPPTCSKQGYCQGDECFQTC